MFFDGCFIFRENSRQGVDVGVLRGPAHGEAHHHGVRAVRFPHLELGMLCDFLRLGLGEDDELLVRGESMKSG